MERLSGDSLLHILGRFELHDLGKLRCVCRSWHSLIGSPEFERVWEHRHRACTVIRVRPIDGKLQDFHTEVWFPGSSSSSSIVVPKSGLSPGPPGSLCLGVTGSSQGLVCGLVVRGDSSAHHDWRWWGFGKEWEFVVGNPVTNRWRTLPPLPLPFVGLERIHIHQDEEADGGYKLVVVFCDRGGIGDAVVAYWVHQYDSSTGLWTCPAEPFIGRHAEDSGELRGSVIGSLGLHIRPFFLAAYDPASMAWSCHKHFELDPDSCKPVPLNGDAFEDDDDFEFTSCFGVWGWRGKVIIVTNSPKYLVLSELDRIAGKWKVLAKVRYRELYRHLGVEWESVRSSQRLAYRTLHLAGDLMIFTSLYYPGHNPGVYAPIAYDLATSEWHTFDRYRFRSVDAEACFAFVPSFTAQP